MSREGTKDVCVFLFTFHHSVCDGMSLAAMMKKFCRVLNSIMKQEPVEIQPHSLVLPPRDYYIDKAIKDMENQEGKCLKSKIVRCHTLCALFWFIDKLMAI